MNLIISSNKCDTRAYFPFQAEFQRDTRCMNIADTIDGSPSAIQRFLLYLNRCTADISNTHTHNWPIQYLFLIKHPSLIHSITPYRNYAGLDQKDCRIKSVWNASFLIRKGRKKMQYGNRDRKRRSFMSTLIFL